MTKNLIEKPFFVKLPDRGLIHLEGEDRHTFLQNLISNDIRALKNNPLYTCILSAQGKFLFDGFVREGNDFTLIECEGGARAQRLFKHLNLYKLRSKVRLSVEENTSVYSILSPAPTDPINADPRHPAMGARVFEKPAGLEEKDFSAWDTHRIHLNIPDGSRDMIVDKDVPLDCNIDKINGVSFDKGCYIGQEITSRMQLRGLVKKHLRVVEWKNGPVPEPFTDIHVNGELIGQMRSHCGNTGLMMIRDDALPISPDAPFTVI